MILENRKVPSMLLFLVRPWQLGSSSSWTVDSVTVCCVNGIIAVTRSLHLLSVYIKAWAYGQCLAPNSNFIGMLYPDLSIRPPRSRRRNRD